MTHQVKSEVRMSRGTRAFRFECPMNLTEKEKEQYARDQYKKLMKKRAYGFKFEVIL